MKKPTKKQLIELIVAEVNDYDIETLIECCKDYWRAILTKRTPKQLAKQLADRSE